MDQSKAFLSAPIIGAERTPEATESSCSWRLVSLLLPLDIAQSPHSVTVAITEVTTRTTHTHKRVCSRQGRSPALLEEGEVSGQKDGRSVTRYMAGGRASFYLSKARAEAGLPKILFIDFSKMF